MPLDLSTTLKHYKRKEIQQAIVRHVGDKEVAAQFNDMFGKRPDMLRNELDVLELARQGATSFHCSEERWLNPMQLSTILKKTELDQLRSGWDLVLDIDCKVFEYSRIAADLIVKFLTLQGAQNVSVKYSGNKGFHVGVPFEAFPKEIGGKDIRLLFPDAARRIAFFVKENIKHRLGEKIMEFEGKNIAAVKEKTKCGNEVIGYRKDELRGNVPFLNAEPFLEIDTILLASRHLYRAPYSLHEKSGLVSVPVDPKKVLAFEKHLAEPEKVDVGIFGFLERNAEPDGAKKLLLQAFDFRFEIDKTEKDKKAIFEMARQGIQQEVQGKIPAQYFPPCINLILQGLEDGRKRGLFILLLFFKNAGYTKEETEKIAEEWNKKNREPLREGYLQAQLKYFHQRKTLPPNCAKTEFMVGIGVCKPDAFCKRIKNPFQYAKFKNMLAGRMNEGKSSQGGSEKQTKNEKKDEMWKSSNFDRTPV